MPAATQEQGHDARQRTGDGPPSAVAPAVKVTIGDQVAGAYSLAQRSLDRVVPPSSRRRAYDAASALASSRPMLFVRPNPTRLSESVDGELTLRSRFLSRRSASPSCR